MPLPHAVKWSLPVSFLFVALAACGCGRANYLVTGNVLLGGKPLPKALVTFVSTEDENVLGMGETNEAGEFSIDDEYGNAGLPAGEYEVRVTTYAAPYPDADPPLPGSRETVPDKYNRDTTLKRTVEAKSEGNQFELKLEATGKITQP